MRFVIAINFTYSYIPPYSYCSGTRIKKSIAFQIPRDRYVIPVRYKVSALINMKAVHCNSLYIDERINITE